MKLKKLMALSLVAALGISTLTGCGNSADTAETATEESTGSCVEWMKESVEKLCDVMGIITEKQEEILDSEIEDMIAQRQAARKAKNFALADEIRGKLLEMGIVLEDTREGVKWKRA